MKSIIEKLYPLKKLSDDLREEKGERFYIPKISGWEGIKLPFPFPDYTIDSIGGSDESRISMRIRPEKNISPIWRHIIYTKDGRWEEITSSHAVIRINLRYGKLVQEILRDDPRNPGTGKIFFEEI